MEVVNGESEPLKTGVEIVTSSTVMQKVTELRLQDNSASSSMAAHSENWRYAALIEPYKGQLTPKTDLQSAVGFASVYSKYHEERSIFNVPNPHDPVVKILNMYQQKFDELFNLRRFQLKNFDNEPVSLIGEGSFVQTHLRKFMGNKDVAVKQFFDCRSPTEIFKEVHSLIHLQHKRVLKIYGAFFEDDMTYLVTELYSGSLHQHLKAISKRQVVRFTIQLIEGMEFLHSNNIVHCDFNPYNCFITRHNNIVIGEFSKAQLLPQGSEFVRTGVDKPFLGRKTYSDSLANRGIYSKGSDIFGLGCTIFEMDSTEPLMEYTTWKNAPVDEYVNVAEHGRLVNVPPLHKPDPSGASHGWKLDGKREPLAVRVERCNTFRKIVTKMVEFDPSGRRLGAGELLKKYQSFLYKKLKEVGSSIDDLDKDQEPVDFRPCPKIAPSQKPCIITNRLATAMDHIYFDINPNHDKTESGEVTEPSKSFSAIPVDKFKAAMEEVYKLAVRVNQSGDAITGRPKTSTSKVPTAVKNLLSSDLVKAVIESANQRNEGLSKNRESRDVGPGSLKNVKEHLHTSSNKGIGMNKEPVLQDVLLMKRKQKEEQDKLYLEIAAAAEGPPKSSSTRDFVRSPTPTDDNNSIKEVSGSRKKKYRRINVADTDSDEPEDDVHVTPSKKRRHGCSTPPKCKPKDDMDPKNQQSGNKIDENISKSRAMDAEPQISNNRSKTNDKAVKELNDQSLPPPTVPVDIQKNKRMEEGRKSNRQSKKPKQNNVRKEVHGGTGNVPNKDRGYPAPPKNLPADILATRPPGWRGWIDCECKEFWNVDYELVMTHRRTCSVVIELEKKK